MSLRNIKKFVFEVVPQPLNSFWVINDLNSLQHPVKRIFFSKSKEKELRGDHAHMHCWQTLVCLEGKIIVSFDDGKEKTSISLESEGEAVTMPPKIWSSQEYDKDSYLMVLCSHIYDSEDYERDYQEFLKKVVET